MNGARSSDGHHRARGRPFVQRASPMRGRSAAVGLADAHGRTSYGNRTVGDVLLSGSRRRFRSSRTMNSARDALSDGTYASGAPWSSWAGTSPTSCFDEPAQAIGQKSGSAARQFTVRGVMPRRARCSGSHGRLVMLPIRPSNRCTAAAKNDGDLGQMPRCLPVQSGMQRAEEANAHRASAAARGMRTTHGGHRRRAGRLLQI